VELEDGLRPVKHERLGTAHEGLAAPGRGGKFHGLEGGPGGAVEEQDPLPEGPA